MFLRNALSVTGHGGVDMLKFTNLVMVQESKVVVKPNSFS